MMLRSRLNAPAIMASLLALVLAGCASNDEMEGLTLFPKIAKAREYFNEARRKVQGIGDNPVEEDLERIDEAMKLNEKAMELVPDASDFQFFHALLLQRRGLYHDNQGIYWGERAKGNKFNKEAEKWIKEFPLPSSEDREKWRRQARQNREIADGFFNRALRRLDIVERIRGDEPQILDVRGKIYILMMDLPRARDIYVRLSRDTRLTDEQRAIALEMIQKIDKNEFYRKQKGREDSSIFKSPDEE